MWKVFLISVGFCAFFSFQALGQKSCKFAFGDLKLSAPIVRLLNEADIYDVEGLRKLTERELRGILQNSASKRWVVQRIKNYLSTRGGSLERDFLVDDVGLSIRAADSLNRAGIRTEEDLLRWTESLLALEGISKVATGKIKVYLSRQGKFLSQGVAIEDMELSIETGRSSGRVGNYNMDLSTENQFSTILPNGDSKQVLERVKGPRLW